MIRFSAGLVVVAIGVLIGGVATSKLLLVYVAIGLSAVALVALAIGVVLKREELFGEERQAPAPAAAGVSAGQLGLVGQTSIQPNGTVEAPAARVPAAASAAFGEASRGTDSAGWYRPDQPPFDRPAYGQGAPANSPGTPANSQGAFGQAAPPAPPAPSDSPIPPWRERPSPSYGGTFGFSAPGFSAPVSAAGPPWTAPAEPTASTPRWSSTPSWFDRPARPAREAAEEEATPRDSAETDTPTTGTGGGTSAWSWSTRSPLTADTAATTDHLDRSDETYRSDEPWSATAFGSTDAPESTDASDIPESIDTSSGTDASGSADTSAEDDDWWPSRSWLVDDEADKPGTAPSATSAGEIDAAVTTSDVEIPDDDAAEDGTPEATVSKAGNEAATDSATEDDTYSAEATEGDTSDDDDVAPVPSAHTDTPAEADTSTDADSGSEAGTDAGAEEFTWSADLDFSGPGAALAEVDSTEDDAGAAAETTGSGEQHDEPSVARGSGVQRVTVVPGVPRYHDGNCILIRFIGDDDVQKVTVQEAIAAGCTPCRACQPDTA